MRSESTTLYPGTNAVFSPDEKYVATGVGATSKGGQGCLLLLNRTDLSVIKELGMESTPVKVVWHSKINQIVTGLSNGTISVLYSAEASTHGAKLLLSKGAPKRPTVEDMSDALAAPTILTPHALPMFKDGDGIVKGTKRKREKDRLDPRKSRRPELPVTGPGKGGRVGASATQHVVQNLVRDTTRDEDVSDLVVFAFYVCVDSGLLNSCRVTPMMYHRFVPTATYLRLFTTATGSAPQVRATGRHRSTMDWR